MTPFRTANPLTTIYKYPDLLTPARPPRQQQGRSSPHLWQSQLSGASLAPSTSSGVSSLSLTHSKPTHPIRTVNAILTTRHGTPGMSARSGLC